MALFNNNLISEFQTRQVNLQQRNKAYAGLEFKASANGWLLWQLRRGKCNINEFNPTGWWFHIIAVPVGFRTQKKG